VAQTANNPKAIIIAYTDSVTPMIQVAQTTKIIESTGGNNFGNEAELIMKKAAQAPGLDEEAMELASRVTRQIKKMTMSQEPIPQAQPIHVTRPKRDPSDDYEPHDEVRVRRPH
jgi:hypothetical protein